MFKKENRMTTIFILIILAFVGLAVWGSFAKEADETAKPLPTSTEKEFALNEQPVVGDKDAPVEMIVFADYQCNHCKAWSDDIYPIIKEKLLDTGKANLTFVNFPVLGPRSTYAAMASEYVYKENAEKWYDFYKELYANQSILTNSFIAKKVTDYVDGVTQDEIIDKLEKEHFFIDDVLSDYKKAEEMGATGTPSLFVNGVKVDHGNVDNIEKMVDGLIKKEASTNE